MRRDKPDNIGKKIMALCLSVLLVALVCLFIHVQENDVETSIGEIGESFETQKVITVEGKSYREKRNLTTILLIGYDRTDTASTVYRNGGQSDFMMLAVFDNGTKQIHRLQLDRDTMAQVGVLSVLGKDMGTNTLQLCLAHGYGASPQQCNERTVKAVSNLLQGVDIEFYIALPMSGITTFNDALGGVDLVIEDDFSGIDDTLVLGQKVHLAGQHVDHFIRGRAGVGNGTNNERMRRHRAYIEAAIQKISDNLQQDESFANHFLNALDQVLETNMSKGRLINEINRVKHFDILPTETFEGEYKLGNNGFVEFYVKEQTIVTWVLDTFYTVID